MPGVNLDNSRQLDVHTWSDHPEANYFVNIIWDTFFAEKYVNTGPGKRPKSRPKTQLKVLLLDLYVSWTEDPDQFIGIGMSKRFYKASSRYNALYISEIMIGIAKTLEASGQIELHPGTEGSGRVTRIKAINLLEDLFRRAELSQFDISTHQDEEVIVLSGVRSVNDTSRRKIPKIEYSDEDNPEIPRMRKELTAYNNLLLKTFIDIPTLEEPIVTYETKGTHKEERIVRLGQQNKFVRRIFYRGSWDLGGRFHGGWWQLIRKSWRKVIHINDNSTTEIDYKGLHVNLLYGLSREVPPEDPYQIDSHDIDLIIEPEVFRFSNTGYFDKRKLVKSLVLIAINARNEKSAFRAFRSEQPTDSRLKKLKDNQLRKLLDVFREKNPVISDSICADQGVSLMHLDGIITANLINHFTERNIPILTIHDSYIVERQHGEELREVMRETVKALLNGFEIQVDEEDENQDMYYKFRDKGPPWEDRDIIGKHPVFQDTEGYLRRMDLFNKWLATQ